MAEVKFKITNNGSISGKKEIAYLTAMPFNGYGSPSFVGFLIRFKETDEITDAIPADSTLNARRVINVVEYNFQIGLQKISSVTKLYLPDDTVDVDAITLQDYFATKVINSFPGVAGGDQAWKFAEGVLKEVVAIMQTNGELSI